MNLKNGFTALRSKFHGAQALAVTALVLSPVGSVLATVTDPSTEIVAEINKGKGYGIAAAVAFAVAVWAITSIHMARRKG